MKKKLMSLFSSPLSIIFIIYTIVALSSFLIPSGQYERVFNELTKVTEIQSETFCYIEKDYISFMDFFRSIHQGFVAASDIIFMCFFSCFYIGVINATGALDAGINSIIKKFGNNTKYMIPVMILIISFAGYSYGEMEDIYPLIPLFVVAAKKVGYDDIMGIAISGGAVMIGFASSAFNPYTIGVAQSIAELPMYSGALYRTIIYVVMVTLYIWWVMRYGKNLLKSGIGGKIIGNVPLNAAEEFTDAQAEEQELQTLTWRHKVILLGFAVVIFFMIYGALNWGWYFTEISALFIIGAFATSIFQRYSAARITELLIQGMSDILMGVLVIGLARSVLVLMESALIIDTIIHALFSFVQLLPSVVFPIGMYIVQSILNFAIPSGSGQAATIMPIMVPLTDLLGVNRQVAVLAFQMGDGFSNLIWPTSSIAIICSIAKVPLEKWYKFFLPFFAIMIVMCCVFLVVANTISLGPF